MNSRPDDLERRAADLAHAVWCQQMIHEGWKPGSVFDPAAMIHDGLRPFEQLSPVDQRAVAIGIRTEEVLETLERAVSLTRGPGREFSAAELSIGLRVRYDSDDGESGSVVGWEQDPAWPGCVNHIRVRWDSGEEHEYVSSECELLRVEELS